MFSDTEFLFEIFLLCHLLLKHSWAKPAPSFPSNFCSFCQMPAASGRALLSLTHPRHFTNWILGGGLVTKAPALQGFPHGRTSALVCMWGNLLYRHLFPSRWVRTTWNPGKKQGWNHWHHLVPQKKRDDEVGLEELLEKEEMPSAMLIPCPSQGTDFMGKAGPMQSVSQDSMVRVTMSDQVRRKSTLLIYVIYKGWGVLGVLYINAAPSQAGGCWFCLNECLQITGISLNSCALWI